MNDVLVNSDENDAVDIPFDFDGSDEELESTAQAEGPQAFTLGSCTGLSVCPG